MKKKSSTVQQLLADHEDICINPIYLSVVTTAEAENLCVAGLLTNNESASNKASHALRSVSNQASHAVQFVSNQGKSCSTVCVQPGKSCTTFCPTRQVILYSHSLQSFSFSVCSSVRMPSAPEIA